MDARDVIKIGMTAERTLVVPPERTVGHLLPGMPMVYATPMMILEMEMTSGDAINRYLEPGWVTVGTEVDIRHLAASPVGAKAAAAIASNQEWREARPAQFSCREDEIVAKVREVLARHDVKWG